MSDFQHWVDDPHAPPLVRELLAEARADVLEPAAVTRVRGRLDQAVAGGAGPGAALAAKAAGISIGAGLLVAAAIFLSPPDDPPMPPVENDLVEVAVEAASAAPVPARATAPDQAARRAPEPRPAPARERGSSPKQQQQAKPSTPREPAATEAISSSTPTAEAQLLLAARRALPRQPERALALAAQHERDFPAGLLTEEREVIALRALVALERMEEARVRARAFVRDYPGSGHASAVKKAVGEEG